MNYTQKQLAEVCENASDYNDVERDALLQAAELLRSFSKPKGYITTAEEADRLCKIQWQPIETAPKDGTLILTCAIFDNGENSMILPAGWCSEREGFVFGFTQIKSGTCFQIVTYPTHWLPLDIFQPPTNEND